MTQFRTERPDAEIARESRTPVLPRERMAGGLFQGWGPKL
jgi:hypothetical protein